MGIKDRCLLVYRFPDHEDGLNPIGVGTTFFQFTPSVFGLRINQTVLINISFDAYFAKYLGCYYPVDLHYDLNLKGIRYSEFAVTSPKPKRLTPVFKPNVAIYQSILDIGQEVAGSYYLNSGVSVPFLSRDGKLTPLSLNEPVVFDSVLGGDATFLWQLSAYVFDLQQQLTNNIDFRGTRELEAHHRLLTRAILKETKTTIEYLISEYGKDRSENISRLKTWKSYRTRLL